MANLSNINNKFLVTTGGNVGINVTGPTKKIDVYQDTVGLGAADFRHINGNRILINPSYNYYDAYNHIFRGLNGTDTHMTIDLNGNVGIGTVSPSSKLSVFGTQAAIDFQRGTGDSKWEFSSDSVKLYIAEMSTGTRNYVMSIAETTGNVGIGTVSPSSILSVEYDNIVNNHTPAVFFESKNSLVGSGDVLDVYTARGNGFTDGYIARFRNASDTKVYIRGDGNVGIGTDVPTAQLQIESTSAGAAVVAAFLVNESVTVGTETRLAFAANTNNDIATGRYSYISTINTSGSNGQAMTFATNETGASAVEKMRITSGGNVGIGTTSPSSKLEVRSETATHKLVSLNRAASVTAAMYLGNDSSNNAIISSNYSDLIFGRDQSSTLSEWMRIKRDGNVGIGTTSPGHKLEVAGDLQLDASNANIWIKSGAAGTNGFINWTFNTDNTVFIKTGIDYDTRASLGYHIDSGYPITIDCTNYIDFKRSAGVLGRWNSSGLGIGTTSPVNKLGIEVAANSNTKAINIYSKNTSPNSYTSIGSQYSISNTYVESEIRFGNETQSGGGSYLGFVAGGSNSGNTEKMRITSTGAISVGSTGTAYGAAGEVLTSNGNASPSWQAAGGSSPWTTSASGTIYYNTGKVGIGTTSPNFGLVASLNALAGTVNDGVMFGMETTTNAGNTGYRFKSGGEYYQVLYNGSSIQWKNYDAAYNTKMTLTNDGNLNIGVSSPVAKLDVNGDCSYEDVNTGTTTVITATKTLEFTVFLDGGSASLGVTYSLLTMNQPQYNTSVAVATMEYGASLDSGTGRVGGSVMAVTKWASNWYDEDNIELGFAGTTSGKPSLFWEYGVLKVTAKRYCNMVCRIRLTYRGFGSSSPFSSPVTTNYPT